MSQSPFSQVFRKGFSLTQGGRTPAEERAPAAPKTSDRQAASARRTNVLYVVGDARETKFVSGAFDKAYPHLNLDFSVPLADARQRIAEAGRYDALLVGWSVPEAEALSLITYVREQSHPVAIIAAYEQSPERFRQAGADECAQKGASYLAKVPAAIDEAMQKRGSPRAAAAPAQVPQSLRVAYSGDLEFVKTALKGEASSLQFMPLADALTGTACDLVLLDHTPASNTATTLAEVRGRNFDVPVVLLLNAPDENAVFRTFASDVHEFIVKTPGWATRLPLRLDVANTRYQQLRELASLRIKEARLRTLVDTLPACIVRLSPEGTVLAVNAVAISLLGASEARQLLRKQFFSLVNPSDRETCGDFIKKVCGGEQRSIEISVTTLSGEGRVLEIKAVPVSAEAGGGVASALTVLRDVTERKRLEASMEQVTAAAPAVETPTVHEVERFGEPSTIVETPVAEESTAPVIETFARVEDAAPKVEERAPKVEQRAAKVEEPAPRVEERSRVAAADPGLLRELEADLHRLSGRARAAFEELEASLRDAEARHEAVSARQLEEQAKLEAIQVERWRSYDAFVQAAIHGIFHATPAHDLLDVNPSFASALGYESPDDLIAEGTSIGRLTPENDWRLAAERWREGTSNELVETRWKRKDGTLLTLRLLGRMIGGPQGSDERLEVIAENVTAQRSLETQLRRARKWEDVARVTTGIAADLKHVVESLNESADRYVTGLSLEDADRAHVAAIQQGASKAFSLSKQLVAFGRKESRDSGTLDVNAVVRALEEVVRRVTDEHIELALDLSSTLQAVEADRATVEEALVNLSVAVSDALPAGGTINIATTNVDVERHSAEHPHGLEPGSYVLLTLTAAGWGIERDIQERLARKPVVSVKRALERIGGCLKGESTPGESLTFGVYLPHVQAAEAVES